MFCFISIFQEVVTLRISLDVRHMRVSLRYYHDNVLLALGRRQACPWRAGLAFGGKWDRWARRVSEVGFLIFFFSAFCFNFLCFAKIAKHFYKIPN